MQVAERKEMMEPEVDHFFKYKGRPMVRIKGNFYGGGFSISKNKLMAIRKLLEKLESFIDGQLDEKITSLNENQVIKP